MSYYWVNLGTSYNEVVRGSFLWAPQYKKAKNGKEVRNAGWTVVNDVKKGDVVFCHDSGEIKCVAIALSNSYDASRPETRAFKEWDQEGYKVDVELHILDRPVDVDTFRFEMYEKYSDECKPKVFDKNARTTQNYMSKVPKAAALLILKALGEFTIELPNDDLKKSKAKLKETTRSALVNARVGQGQFRKDVLKVWNGACALTGVALSELLVASHIYPWQFSNNDERLDPYNGLPLTPTIDKLFDKGYISFTDDGYLLKASDVNDDVLEKLGINPNTQIYGLSDRHFYYLSKHRKLFKFETGEGASE